MKNTVPPLNLPTLRFSLFQLPPIHLSSLNCHWPRRLSSTASSHWLPAEHVYPAVSQHIKLDTSKTKLILLHIKLALPWGFHTTISLGTETWRPGAILQFSSVQSLSHIRLFATLWTSACQASLSITNSQSLHKLMSIELGMPSSHLILCRPLLLLPSIFPSIRVFSNESALLIRWPKYWSFSFSISPSNKYSELISFRIDWFDLLEVQGTLKSLLQ